MNLVIKAPRHRYYTVFGLLLSCRVEILNETELESTVLSREPLVFRFETADVEAIKNGLAELKREFGEQFQLKGAD